MGYKKKGFIIYMFIDLLSGEFIKMATLYEQYRELNQSWWCTTLVFSTIFSVSLALHSSTYKASNVRRDKYGWVAPSWRDRVTLRHRWSRLFGCWKLSVILWSRQRKNACVRESINELVNITGWKSELNWDNPHNVESARSFVNFRVCNVCTRARACVYVCEFNS